MMLVYTILHSGTRSLLADLGEPHVIHCDVEIDFDDYDEIYTTRRSPIDVAGSWVNEYQCALDSHHAIDLWPLWKIQWTNWSNAVKAGAIVLPVESLKHHKYPGYDVTGIKKAIADNNRKIITELIPDRFIQFAEGIYG